MPESLQLSCQVEPSYGLVHRSPLCNAPLRKLACVPPVRATSPSDSLAPNSLRQAVPKQPFAEDPQQMCSAPLAALALVRALRRGGHFRLVLAVNRGEPLVVLRQFAAADVDVQLLDFLGEETGFATADRAPVN